MTIQASSPGGSERTARLASSPALFDNRFVDYFSRIHPAVPALIYVPLIFFMVWLGHDRSLSAGRLGAMAGAGLVIWTLAEYWLHRLVFHWRPSFPGGERLHFMIHGVHHEHPNDAMRLVMPPAASIPLATIFFFGFTALFGRPEAFPIFGGFLAGYLIYDYTHFFLHHGTPESALGRKLREQHMRHHFQDHHYGFGVSSPLWDLVFGTLPQHRSANRDQL